MESYLRLFWKLLRCSIVYKRKINKFAELENPGVRDKQPPDEGQIYQPLEPKMSDFEQETDSPKYVNVEELRVETEISKTVYTALDFRNRGIPTPGLSSIDSMIAYYMQNIHQHNTYQCNM